MFLSYYNVTQKTFCAEKWRKAMIYYYYYFLFYVSNNCYQLSSIMWLTEDLFLWRFTSFISLHIMQMS